VLSPAATDTSILIATRYQACPSTISRHDKPA
jgi:hypothetical protein